MAIGLFLLLCAIYWASIPDVFNEIRENRRFFDSDGEFITRQFKQGSVFTHNNHLLYHIFGTLIFGAVQSATWAHKVLSVVAGAAGVTILFLGGCYWLKRPLPALLAALFIGGCAGYWFFAATIDTYVPHIAASLAALIVALLCLRTQKPGAYAVLGALMGLAFLLRTDGFLVGATAIVILDRPRRPWARLGALLLGGVVVGLLGYAVLAQTFYGVAPADTLAFAFPDRPEMDSGVWGRWSNVNAATLHLTLVNHALYAVAIPGVEATRSADFISAYGGIGLGALVPTIWAALLVLALLNAVRLAWLGPQGDSTPRGREPFWLLALALLWFVPRIVFYAWWDPYDPFLFACMSLPAFWLLAVINAGALLSADSATAENRWLMAGAFLVAALWLYNFVYLILPMRQASIG